MPGRDLVLEQAHQEATHAYLLQRLQGLAWLGNIVGLDDEGQCVHLWQVCELAWLVSGLSWTVLWLSWTVLGLPWADLGLPCASRGHQERVVLIWDCPGPFWGCLGLPYPYCPSFF